MLSQKYAGSPVSHASGMAERSIRLQLAFSSWS
jgi:hypothetical protein